MAKRGDLSVNQQNANQQSAKFQRSMPLIALVIVLPLLFFTLFLSLALSEDRANDISSDGTEYSGSIFTRYQGRIYAAVPSNGYYVMDADPASFVPVESSPANRHVGVDKNHVYCANRIMPDLDPKRLTIIGNDYYGDGTRTYFCAQGSVRNNNLSAVRELWQQFRFSWMGGPKPQTYLNPMVVMPPAKNGYRKLLDGDFATDGIAVFDRGIRLPNANPATFRRIMGLDEEGLPDRPDWNYAADGTHVYYDGKLTKIADATTLNAFEVGMLYDQHYLIDSATGKLVLNGEEFAPEHAPYTPLTRNDDHSYHALFTGKDGIYFYNMEEEKVERAGDNIFASGKFKAVTPSVFFDGKNIYYLRVDRVRPRRRPIKYYTYVEKLDEIGPTPWRQIGTASSHGLLWSNGRDDFYFDTLGQSQLIRDAIYRITDGDTKAKLMSSTIRADDVRDMVREGKLIPPKRVTMATALTIDYRERWMRYFPWGFGLFIVIVAAFKIYGKRDEWRNFGRNPVTVP